MKYLFLVYTGAARAVDAVFRSDGETLREGGYLLNALYLRSAANASAVRLRNGELAPADDSTNEPQDQLAALYVVNARDLNEAVRVASRLSAGAAKCLVEVRSMLDFDWLSG